MKTILCYGDSNTWGYCPQTKQRFDEKTRWTGVLHKTLSNEYRIIEEGLNGRTTIHNENDRPFRSGLELLPVLMESHAPIDLVIIMLGTNDLKKKFNSSIEEITKNIRALCQHIQSCAYNRQVKTLLISPTHICEMKDEDANEFEGAIEKSHQFADHYQEVAIDLDMFFCNAAEIVETSKHDGIHWDADQHRLFAQYMKDQIRLIL